MHTQENPYSFGRQLGDGVDAVVRVLFDSSSSLQFACKSVPKSLPDAVRHARTEISMLEKLRGHPNIISLHHHFEDDQSIHLVLDLCEGGDLCEHVKQKGRLSELEAAQAMVAILRAVSFCHEKGIVHRDLKPDNILLPRWNSSYAELKLADFGASGDLYKKKFFTELEGTARYLAPEVLTGNYDEKADIWSLGVILYSMLSGYLPFDGEGPIEIFQSIRRGRLDLKSDPWPFISPEAKDLVKGMLQRNPFRRLKLRDVFLHPWLQASFVDGSEVLDNLQASESVVVIGG